MAVASREHKVRSDAWGHTILQYNRFYAILLSAFNVWGTHFLYLVYAVFAAIIPLSNVLLQAERGDFYVMKKIC